MEVILFAFVLRRSVDLVGTNLLDGHFHVVHPLNHFLPSCVVHLLYEGVVLLPKRHGDGQGGLL